MPTRAPTEPPILRASSNGPKLGQVPWIPFPRFCNALSDPWPCTSLALQGRYVCRRHAEALEARAQELARGKLADR